MPFKTPILAIIFYMLAILAFAAGVLALVIPGVGVVVLFSLWLSGLGLLALGRIISYLGEIAHNTRTPATGAPST